jgi:hypothetical protein
MKKMIAFVAMLIAAPVVASEPADLSGLGLAGLQTVSDQAGMEVRGLSSSAYGAGLSTMRLFAIDPSTGSTANINMSSFNTASADATVGDPAQSDVGTSLAFSDISFSIGNTSGQTVEGNPTTGIESAFVITLGGQLGGFGSSGGNVSGFSFTPLSFGGVVGDP